MKPASAPERSSPGSSPDDADEALMERFCQGDARAFDALFRRYGQPVHRYLCRLVKSSAAAEDLCQATFVSLVKARGRFQPGARFRPWLYAIATNAARDHLRRRVEAVTPEGELPEEPVAPAGRDVGLEKAVRAALEQLPPAQREAIVLHRFEGMSFSEIADAVGLSESAVKVRAHRGYERLRALLQRVWDDA